MALRALLPFLALLGAGAFRANINLHDHESTRGHCPNLCKNVNLQFMRTAGKTDQELRDHIQKKCAFSICGECDGGELGVPCCMNQEDCEVIVDEEEFDEKDMLMPTPLKMTIQPLSSEPKEIEVYETQKGEVCKHSEETFCPPDSKNVGAKYAKDGKPLCCKNSAKEPVAVEQTSNEDFQIDSKDGGDSSWIIDNYFDNVFSENVKEGDPEKVPDCPEDGLFEVKQLQAGDRCMNMRVGLSVDMECCTVQNAASLIAEKLGKSLVAQTVCATVEDKYCKDDGTGFDSRHRKKYPQMPAEFTCAKRYYCTDGTLNYGPVESQIECLAKFSGMSKNLPANRRCIAVPAVADSDDLM